MEWRLKLTLLTLVLALVLFAINSNSRPPKSIDIAPKDALTFDNDSWIDANSVLMFVSNSGSFAYDKDTRFAKYDGCYFPFTTISAIENDSTHSVIFSAGIWLGGIDSASGDTLLSASDYFTDFWPGPMDSGTYIGTAEFDPAYRVFKLYADSMAGNPNTDYLEWPSSQGAPIDSAGNPRLTGDQTLWSVYNDANHAVRAAFAGSDSGIGIEVQSLVWAKDSVGPNSQSIFSKYKIINKGSKTLHDAFISFWIDPDLGGLEDDLIGCDTLDNIFYCYNDGADAYYGSAPPAVGVKLIQGPITPSLGDTAFIDSTPIPNFKNLDMYSFGRFYDGLDPQDYTWAYRYMKGLDASQGGAPYANGTRYAVPGDPVMGSGDIDTILSDRRMMASFGPFDFRPNDTQQIIIKLGVGQSTSALASLVDLESVLNYGQPTLDCCVGIRGDHDGNGTTNDILDLTFLVNRIFRGGPVSPCIQEADEDSNGIPANILDLTYLVNDLFRGGPNPGLCPLQ